MKRRIFIKNALVSAIALSASEVTRAASRNTNGGYLHLIPDPDMPRFLFFSVDSLGKNKLEQNLLLNQPDSAVKYISSILKSSASYYIAAQNKVPVWKIDINDNSFTLTSNYYKDAQPFVLNFSQQANHITLLGIMKGEGKKVNLPAVLHAPDAGTLRITCSVPEWQVDYDAVRFIEFPFVKVSLPAATAVHPVVVYRFEVTTVYPSANGIHQNSLYDCFRRNFISIFQLNPTLKILANNSASDACAFTLYFYSEVAKYTPALADGLTAMDLIRMTLDRYLSGTKGYGLLGYDYDKTWDIKESDTTCNTLDSYPSLLIAACNYTLSAKDAQWFEKNHGALQTWITKMLATDTDDDGLLEFCLSGNSGSWKGDSTMRPANWWDTIGFGHKDAYSNALAYYALTLLEQTCRYAGKMKEADLCAAQAVKLKAVYTHTFYNETTGVLAGWKSADGKLHDYYFTFVNAMAICYDLIETSLANRIMDVLLAKMKEVGFTNFELGLPGNLIPVIRADYTDLKPEVGGGKREDNLDGFQIYENGGATACYTYFTIRALQKLGRKKDADSILIPLLKSMNEGNFQGRCSNGRSKDWKTWSGECWGYEGFLVDNYMFLLTVLPFN